MYPYTKEIDLVQIKSLKEQIVSGEIPDIQCMPINSNELIRVSISDASYILSTGKLLVTALDYATHILKQPAPPEGWGYAAYDLSSGRYEGLPFKFNFNQDIWRSGNSFISKDNLAKGWNEVAFRLTDLARVENPLKELGTFTEGMSQQEKDALFDEKVEINAAQVSYLDHTSQKITYWQNDAEFTDNVIDGRDVELAKEGYVYKILTSTYNSLPQEFKNLGISEMETTQPPIPPSGIKPPVTSPFDNQWYSRYQQEYATNKRLRETIADLEAKFNAQSQEAGNLFLDATERATLQGKIAELEAKLDETNKLWERCAQENRALAIVYRASKRMNQAYGEALHIYNERFNS